jgi:hypothetical protein
MARVQKDIMIGEDMDILIVDGNLVFGDATMQHQQVILLAHKGELKASPLLGVGVSDWLLEDDDNMLSLKIEIQKQLESDGLTISKLDTMSRPIKLEASYE